MLFSSTPFTNRKRIGIRHTLLLMIAVCLPLFLTNSVMAADNEETIVVCLKTEAQRLPLYLTHFDSAKSGFDPSYGPKLEKVLQFDLDHNGMTYLLKGTNEKEKQAAANALDQIPKPADWKALGAYYVVKVRIQDKTLSARMFAANGGTAKSIEGLPLTGDIALDRR